MSRAYMSAWVLVCLLLAGCGFLPQETGTPTISSDEILQTAQAIAEQTRQGESPTAVPSTPTPSPTVTQATPTPEATVTPSTPSVTAKYNANVRRGPDESYEVLDFLLQDQRADVIGRYENPNSGTWWYITREQGRDGWIWNGAVNLAGNVSAVGAMTPPPTSTFTPEPATDTPTPSPTWTETPTPTNTP